MKLFRRMIAFPLALGLTGGALLLGASPASAHYDFVALYYNDVHRASGTWSADHHTVGACDMRADGWGVRVYYGLADGSTGVVKNYGGYQSPGTCVKESVGSWYRGPVRWIQVCAGDNGANTACSKIKWVS